jgi:hypothetical protein
VSIVQDLRTRGRHRGKTPWQLVQTIGRLEREADENTCQMVAMATEVDDANERADNAEKALAQAEETIRLRDQRITELLRRLDVAVKAEHVIAKTQELSVEEIRRHCVMPLHQSPLADPAHVPGMAHT